MGWSCGVEMDYIVIFLIQNAYDIGANNECYDISEGHEARDIGKKTARS